MTGVQTCALPISDDFDPEIELPDPVNEASEVQEGTAAGIQRRREIVAQALAFREDGGSY